MTFHLVVWTVIGGQLMNTIETKWPPHLCGNVVDKAKGWNLDAYLVALEGWRRGLDLGWHTKDHENIKQMETWFVDEPGRLFSLSNDSKTHFFFRTRGDKVTNEAVIQGSNKLTTKSLLLENNVPTPVGGNFNIQLKDDIINYAHKIKYPVVIKPVDGSFGRGVFSNILNDTELETAINSLREVYNETDIIIEKYIKGNEYRIYVVDNKVVAAINRVPANIVGDGVHSIEQLISHKNEQRALNPRLYSCLIKVDTYLHSFLNKMGYKIFDIPDKEAVIYLNNKSNISLGGDSIDVLDELPRGIKQIAVNGLRSVPGLKHGAVDLIIDENDENPDQAGYIIELNPTAQIGSLVYPMHGYGRDVPSAIIDYYFPETKIKKHCNRRINFDFDASIAPLLKQTANTVTVRRNVNSDTLTYEFLIKLYEIDQQNLIDRALKRIALHYDISGITEYTSQNELIMKVAINKDIMESFELDLKALGNSHHFEVLSKREYLQPIKQGFEVKDAKRFYIDNLRNKKTQINVALKEKQKLEKRYQQMLSSNSWKITTPLRKVTGLIKGFKKEDKSGL